MLMKMPNAVLPSCQRKQDHLSHFRKELRSHAPKQSCIRDTHTETLACTHLPAVFL